MGCSPHKIPVDSLVYLCCILSTMKQRINVSLNPELVEEARALMKARKFDSLSEFLEALIREEWESKERLQFGLNESPSSKGSTDHPVVAIVKSYRKRAPRP